MTNVNKGLDFLHEVAKRVALKSEEGLPILPDQVFDIFKDTFESITEVRIVEIPVFMPIVIEKEGDSFIARSYTFRICKGIGLNEEEAINNLKEQIETYNKAIVESERKLRLEAMIKTIYPYNSF